MRRYSAFSLLGLFAFVATSATAQTPPVTPPPQTAPVVQTVPTGRITGRVIDASTGRGIDGVAIQVVGKEIIVKSGLDGRYNINRVPTGPLALHLQLMGFAPKQVDSLYLHEDEALEQDITLGAVQIKLNTVVTAAAERGSVDAAMDQQRTSTSIVNSTTAEQIAKSPDGNAAQAVQRVSGINLADNNSVTARGLSDKYTISSLNGARIPSPEPEKRIVPLDMFPSGLLQTITVSKTFTPDLQGDFAGALVNIKTKEFPAKRLLSANFGGGYSSGATGSHLIAARSAGGEAYGMGASKRELPALVKYLGDFEGLTLTQGDQNNVVNSFRNAWTPITASPLPNFSGSMSMGGNDPVLFGHRLGYLLSGTYSSGTDLRDHNVRALAGAGTTRGEAVEVDRFEGQTVSQSVLWGGIANASTMVGARSRISFNGMYNRTADNDATVERGSFEVIATKAKITRMAYVERAVRSLQLTGEHLLAGNKFDWALTSSGVRRDEPDRSEFAQSIEQDTPGGPEILRWMPNNGAIRTFSALDEKSNEAQANYQFNFGSAARAHSIRIGGLVRGTDRDAENHEYSFYSTHADFSVRELPAEQLFDGRFTGTGDSLFSVAPLSLGGSYDARDHLSAGYAMLTYAASDRISFIAGARYENDHLTVNAQSTSGTPVSITKDWSDILPSATMNVQLTASQQLRVAVSQTLSRPEYRELTPVTTQEVLNGELVLGSEKLERARILNGDIRWESYRGAGEVLSVAVFAKRFDKPIERIYRAAAQGHTVSFANAKSADNYGIEVEWRRDLGSVADALAPYAFFMNATGMRSTITLSPDAEASATNLTRRMVGQAPFVANVGITYSAMNSATATLLYNVVGERIQAAGESPLPDVVQQTHHGLDFSLRFPIVSGWSGRIDAKNLLDMPLRTMQGDVVREEYRRGRVLQAGLSWKP